MAYEFKTQMIRKQYLYNFKFCQSVLNIKNTAPENVAVNAVDDEN
jgi:hypothetical protein